MFMSYVPVTNALLACLLLVEDLNSFEQVGIVSCSVGLSSMPGARLWKPKNATFH
jgi:hypothetical protein